MQKTVCTGLFVLQFCISFALFGQGYSEFRLTDSVAVPSVDAWMVTGETAAEFRRSYFVREGRLARPGSPGFSATLPAGTVARVISSRNGAFFGILSVAPAEAPNGTQSLKLSVFAASGALVYEIGQSRHFDDPLPAVGISGRDGAAVLGQGATATVQFWDGRGELQQQVALFPGAGYDLERVLTLDLSRDGGTVAIVAAEQSAAPSGSDGADPAGAFLFRFTPDGRETGRAPLPHPVPAAVAISGDGEFIAAASYATAPQTLLPKTTMVFNRDGAAVAELPLLFRHAAFAGAAGVALLAEKQSAVALHLRDGSVLWQREIPRSEGLISAVQISESGHVSALLVGQSILESGGFVYTDPVLKLIDEQGSLHQNLAIKYQNFRKPTLKMSADGRHIFVGLADGYRIYQAVEPIR